MNSTNKLMLVLFNLFLLFVLIIFAKSHKNSDFQYLNQNQFNYKIEFVQCPIPMCDRVLNATGSQCLYASIETLGRWAEEPKITNPPLTSRPECQGLAYARNATNTLKKLNVHFIENQSNKSSGIALIKKSMQEGRGAAFGVKHHAMVLIHYDEKQNIVKFIDNNDRTLQERTITIDEFIKIWDGWILVIYADVDIIPKKLGYAKAA